MKKNITFFQIQKSKHCSTFVWYKIMRTASKFAINQICKIFTERCKIYFHVTFCVTCCNSKPVNNRTAILLLQVFRVFLRTGKIERIKIG